MDYLNNQNNNQETSSLEPKQEKTVKVCNGECQKCSFMQQTCCAALHSRQSVENQRTIIANQETLIKLLSNFNQKFEEDIILPPIK